MTTLQAHNALLALGLRPYSLTRYNCLADAQDNLNGRSHYVSDENLRCFRAILLSCRSDENGLIFSIIESSRDHETGKPGRRSIVFNALGDIIHRGKHFSTTARAELDRNEAILAHNTLYDLETVLINRATSLRETSNSVMSAIKEVGV